MSKGKTAFFHISVLLTGILFSMYYFPFEFYAFPGINTKMGLAAIGLVILAFSMASSDNTIVNKDILKLVIYAGLVSLIGVVSITFNNTPDTAYASYIVSFCVWLSAAFVVTSLIRQVHGYLSVDLICYYVIAICVFQCIVALCNDLYKPFKTFLDQYVYQGQDFLDSVHRLYGLGASLDTAGARFSCALVMIAYLAVNQNDTSKRQNVALLVISYLLIAVIGNMIARTTSVGLIVSLGYLAIKTNLFKYGLSVKSKRFLRYLAVVLACTVPVIAYLYNNNAVIHNNLRFAFEGVFNFVENGELSTSSTDKLKTMYVFPESLKTWFIGDGYFSNPKDTDPYYVGKITKGGYYMASDVGYIRLIFYFGIIGLLAFSYFLFQSAKICAGKLHHSKTLIFILLLINFIIWLKVASDIFLVFALFLTIGKEENEEYHNRINLNQ